MTDHGQFNRTLRSMLARGRGNEWTMFEEMHLYVRVGRKMVDDTPLLCVQLANMALAPESQRRGTFRRLVGVISGLTDLTIYVEQLLNEPFRDALLRHGWRPARTYEGRVYDVYLPKNHLSEWT